MNTFTDSLVAAGRRAATVLAWGACMALAACGGGGGGASTGSTQSTPATVAAAAQPVVTISATPASVAAGDAVTLTWSAQDTGTTSCDASGAWSGQVALSGTRQVSPSAAGTATYTLTCGATARSVAVQVTAPIAAVLNSVPVTVDSGPAGTNAFNIPFVSVTVCRPGTAICQTIDHVLVDTGSYGLRLMAPLDSSLALPAQKSASGAAVGECAQFVSGYTWGSVAQADVKLGGETALAQSIQVIGDTPGGVTSTPSACTSVGSNIGTVAALGANGILGVGLLKQDCGLACANSAISATYYACSGSACSSISMPLAQQVSNPVASFRTDNNGVVLTMPTVGANGASALAGTLVFGIGTQSNNAIQAETRYAANSRGYFTVIYKGTTMSSSFIDSGSNGMFFNDSSISQCVSNKGFYCPSTALSLSATNMAYDGSASGDLAFSVLNLDQVSANVVAASVGGPSGTQHSSGANSFDWGLPFFFGRRVFVGFEGSASGPYWAY
jgi:hypothetical protein